MTIPRRFGPAVGLVWMMVSVAVTGVWFGAGTDTRQRAGSAPMRKSSTRAAQFGQFPYEEWFVRDVYARLMRYDSAARRLQRDEQGVVAEPDEFLTVAVREIRTQDRAGGPVPYSGAGDGPILQLRRGQRCHRDDPCHVYYDVTWGTPGAQVASPSDGAHVPTGAVTRTTTYSVILTLAGQTRTYTAQVRFHETGDGVTVEPEVIDPLIPGLQQVVADHAPLVVAPWKKYVKTRRYAAVVERIQQSRTSTPALAHVQIGFIQGDDVTREDEGTMLMSEREPCGPSVSLSISLAASEIRPTNSGTPNTTTITVTTSPPTPGLIVNLSFEGETDSGGHIDTLHVGVRPGGTASPPSGTTNSSGVFQATYTAPVIAGRVTVRAHTDSTSATASLTIQVPDLQELGPGSYYVLTGSLPEHPSNHWGTAVANGCLVKIASDYRSQHTTAASLRYNDQSLVMGGKFELRKDWQNTGSHVEHRRGINCDIRMSDVPTANRATLENIFVFRGSPNFGREPEENHWHVRIEGGPCNDTPPTNGATFIAQSVPLSMVAGQTYGVSVTMRNSGTSTWSAAAGHKLGSQNPHDNTLWGLDRVLVPSSIAPGQDASFSFNVVAPSNPGSHSFQWRMLQEAIEWFGAYTPNQVIAVGSAGPQMQPDSAIRGCSGWWSWEPVSKPDAGSCLTYCQQNGANACEWFVNGDCYVEFGGGCYVEPGFSGWSAAVLSGDSRLALTGPAWSGGHRVPWWANASGWWPLGPDLSDRTAISKR